MIIKCPECGHQVSDKAPVCPSCGVEIAGHIIKCSHCGEIYLCSEGNCPNCHHTESAASQISPSTDGSQTSTAGKDDPTDAPIPIAEPIIAEPDSNAATEGEEEKGNHAALLVSFLIALIIGVVLVFLYRQGIADTNTENDDYITAIASHDPQVLQNFLDSYPNAPIAHIDSVKASLTHLRKSSDDWTTVLAANSREAYTAYLSSHPSSPHKTEIEKRLDELDWQQAKSRNTEEAYLGYKERQRDGAHNKEADEILQKLLDHTASATDRIAAVNAVRQLLVGINTRSREKIAGAVAESFRFLGESGATVSTIDQYMRNRLYQADVKTVNWHLGNPIDVTTEKTDDNTSEQHILIPAMLEIERNGGQSRKAYQIRAVVRSGRITSVDWTAK